MLKFALLLLLFSSTVCKPSSPDLRLVSPEKGAPPLIISEDAPPHTVEAAGELARLIHRITGQKPEIVSTPPEPMPEMVLWVGPHPALAAAMPEVDLTFSEPEEIIIACVPGHVAILGNDKMAGGQQVMSGTANAVYTFAQQQLGVRWLWPGTLGEDIPQSATLRVPVQQFRYVPPFRQRALFYRNRFYGPSGLQWGIRQRVTYDSLHLPLGHAFSDWWEKYHQTHPEYFALQPDHTRSPFPSPNLVKVSEGEPGVWNQWLENAAEEHGKHPERTIFEASQNDGSNAGVCVDPRSRAWDHPDGELQQYEWKDKVGRDVALSDRTVRFANQLGEMLEERFPQDDLRLIIMAYGPSKPGPIEAVARKNVIVSYVGQFPTSSEKWRKVEKAQYQAWSQKADALAFRPNLFYYSGSWHGVPGIALSNTAEDFRFLAENRCIGIGVDGTPGHFGLEGFQYYIMAQLMWNPYQDVEALAEDFCQRAFGPAAGSIRAYYRLLEEAQMNVMKDPEWFPGMRTTRNLLSKLIPIAYAPDVLAKADQLLTEASETLQTSPPIYLERLALIERSQQFVRLTVDIITTMNAVRESEGKDYEAVEKAVALVKTRDAFLLEEEAIARGNRRPPVVWPHRLRNTWILTRKLENWLGPVRDTYLQAAAEFRKSGKRYLPPRVDEAAAPQRKHPFGDTPHFRWTGAAGDFLWQNRANWEAVTGDSEWVAVPEPPGTTAMVELGDHVARSGPQQLHLVQDVTVDQIRITAADPRNTYLIGTPPDPDGGIDADSSRLSTLTLEARHPIVQTREAQASVQFDTLVHFSHPRATMELQGRGKVTLDANEAPKATRRPSGPVVCFGDSTTALRKGVETYSEKLTKAFAEKGWKVEVINAGVGGNTTAAARQRFARDVLSRKPSLVIIQFGINDSAIDVWQTPPATAPRVSLPEYRSHLRHFIDEVQRVGSSVILMTPNRLRWTPKLKEMYGRPPYQPEDENGLNVILSDYAEAVREIAKQKQVQLIDIESEYRKLTSTSIDTLLPDGMHPNSAGHDLVYQLLIRKISEANRLNAGVTPAAGRASDGGSGSFQRSRGPIRPEEAKGL